MNMAQCTAQKCDFSCNDEVAVLYCKGCSRRLCLKCKLNVHDKVQQFKDHEVVNIEKEGNLVFKPQPVCVTHKKTFLYYCSRCECLTCEDCMTSNHNEHKTEKIRNVADACRANLNKIIEHFKTKVETVEKKLATIETHAFEIKTDCASYVSRVENTTGELHSIIDRQKLISSTTASDFQYFENQILYGKKIFLNQHKNETADLLLKFENILRETNDSTFLIGWKALQTDVQIINEETVDPLLEPSCIEIFNPEIFTKSVIDEIDVQFQMSLKEQEKTVVSLRDQIGVLQNELTRKQEEIDDLLKLSGQLEEKERKVTELSDENESLKMDIKQKKHNELSKLSEQLKERERKVTELSDENENLKKDIKQRKQNELSKMKEQDKKVTSLTNDISELQNKLTNKQEEIDDLLEMKEQDKKVTSLTNDISELQNKLINKQEEIDVLLKLSGQLKEKERKVTDLSSENENLKMDIKRKQNELSELSGQLKEKEKRVTELSDKNENLKSEIKQRKHKES
ncbi:Hypothetical predicted protein, partial [Mytilus galloprovincialis]